MISREEALANMLTFTTLRRKASQLRGAMDAIKDDLAEWMTGNPDQELARDDGCAAKWVSKQNRVINAGDLTDDELHNAAVLGLLSVGIEKVNDLPDDSFKAALLTAVHVVPGEPYVDISSPNWKGEKSAKSVAKEKAAPLPPPTPLRATPRAQQAPEPAPWTCPAHPDRTPKPSKWEGFYCTASDAETGEYCKLTSKKKAS